MLLPCAATRGDAVLMAKCTSCPGDAWHCTGCYGSLQARLVAVKAKRPQQVWFDCPLFHYFMETDWKELTRNPSKATDVDNSFISYDSKLAALLWRGPCIVCVNPILPQPTKAVSDAYRQAQPARAHEPELVVLADVPQLHPTTFELRLAPVQARVNTWRDVAGGEEAGAKFSHYTHDEFGDVACIVDEPPMLADGPTYDLHRTEELPGRPAVAMSVKWVGGLVESMADLGKLTKDDGAFALQVNAQAPLSPRTLVCTHAAPNLTFLPVSLSPPLLCE